MAKITVALKKRNRKFHVTSFSVILNMCSLNEIIVDCGCKWTQH